MAEQGGHSRIRDAIGKGIRGERVPIAVGDAVLDLRLETEAMKPAVDCLCSEASATPTRKEKPMRPLFTRLLFAMRMALAFAARPLSPAGCRDKFFGPNSPKRHS